MDTFFYCVGEEEKTCRAPYKKQYDKHHGPINFLTMYLNCLQHWHRVSPKPGFINIVY